jgi:hypothetical protein
VVPGRQQRTDIPLQYEVRLPGALDGFGDLGVRLVDQVADLATDRLLPIGQGGDVVVDSRIGLVVQSSDASVERGRLVGARGFEPPTSSSRTMRATWLRHAPTVPSVR